MYASNQFPKQCTCGAQYSQEAWQLLPVLGITEGSVNGVRFTDDLEMRNCGCGNTLAVVLNASKSRWQALVAIVVIIVFAAACGQQTTPPHGWNEILWQGNASQDTALTEQVASVQACMKEYGYTREGDPYFVIVDTEFWCNKNAPDTDGCIYNDIIIMGPSFQAAYPIIINNTPLYRVTIRHEIIHWITGKLNNDHNTEYMKHCSVYN